MAENAKIRTVCKGLPEYISVISSHQCARIRIDDIEIIEQEGRKLHVVTAERDYSFYESMKTIARLLGGRAFYRPMNGMIVNLDHVKDINGYYISFCSGQTVSMGKNSITRVRQAYKRYLLRYPPYTLWEPVNQANAAVAETGDADTADDPDKEDTDAADDEGKIKEPSGW